MFCLSACGEKFLDVPNENGLSTGMFWSTEDDIKCGLTAVYSMFYRQGTWTRNMVNELDGISDEGVLYSSWTELNEWTKFLYTNYDFGEINTKIWSEHWTAINRANQVLDHIDDPGIVFSSEDLRLDYKGQALWLRALYYYYLTTIYENIPLVLKTSSASDTPKGQNPDVIYTQLEKDLHEAIGYLPLKRDLEVARPTRGAAYGLLARIYAQHHKWQEAAECLNWIVEGEGKSIYSLEPNWQDNFSNYTENNCESLYEIQFSLCNYVGWDATDNYLGSDAQLGTQIEISRSPKGMGWQIVESNPWVKEYYLREKTVDGKNDPRLFYSLWYCDAETDFPEHPNQLIYGKTWKQLGYNANDNKRVFVKKYSTDVSPVYYWNDNNFRLIRLADMLLLYAECLNEINNGPTDKAIEYVDRVRTRVNLPRLAESRYYTDAAIRTQYEPFKEHLKIERELELSFEALRWFDLKRWGFDEKNLAAIRERDADFNNFQPGKHERLPIPQSEVDNNPYLDQNPNF